MESSGYYNTGYVWRPDKRGSARVRVDSMLSVERLEGDDRVGHIEDLSLGGVRFQSVGPRLVREEVVRVAFNMGTDTFTLFGRISRLKQLDPFSQEVALVFTGMDPERREALARDLYPSLPGPAPS
jgi:hypothetical protein